jgi:hypothetical protein
MATHIDGDGNGQQEAMQTHEVEKSYGGIGGSWFLTCISQWHGKCAPKTKQSLARAPRHSKQQVHSDA